MAREDWDLFLVVFSESHPAGHYFWHYHDPSYLTHPKARARSPMRCATSVALDGAIGELLAAVDGDTTVWLASGDGICANYSGSHILPQMLRQMGALHTSAPEPSGGPAASPEGRDGGAGPRPRRQRRSAQSRARSSRSRSGSRSRRRFSRGRRRSSLRCAGKRRASPGLRRAFM